MKFEAEGKEFAKILRSLEHEQFIQTVKGQNNFWEQKAFLIALRGFSHLTIRIQIGKNYWDLETWRKS